jgi:hypothetical protein
VRREIEFADPVDRLVVVCLAQQTNVKERQRVVQPGDAVRELRDDRRFAEERHEDRVLRQRALVQGGDLLIGDIKLILMSQGAVDEIDLVEGDRDVEQAGGCHHRDQSWHWKQS